MALEPLFLDLIQVYRDAYQTLLTRLVDQELRGLSTFHTKALLRDIDDTVEKLKQYQSDWINHAVPFGYQEGSQAVVDKLTKRYGMTDINVAFGGVHTEAVNAIVRDTFSDIAAATDFMADNLKQAIRDAAKEQYRIGLITGETRRSMTKGLVDKLSRKGFTVYLDEKGRYIPLREYANALLEEQWVGFVDKAGRRWDLLNYSEMLTRTKVLEASNVGTENRMVQNGLDLVLISSHHADDWCRFYENRVFSISGQSSEYPPLSQVPNGGCPMHPRCKHSETPFLEKFESEELIEYGKGTDKKYMGLNLENGRADQAKLRSLERLEKEKASKIITGDRKYFQSVDIKNKVQMPGLTAKAYKETMNSFSLALEHGRATNTECLLTLDAKTGKRVYNKIDGEQSQVVFPKKYVDFLNNSDDNSLLIIHNHPSSSSFSSDDINILTIGSVNKLGVVGHDQTLYYIERKGSSVKLSDKKISFDYKTAQAKYFSYYQEKVLSGAMTQQEAWKEHSHKMLEEVAEKNNLNYRRWLPDEQ